MAKTIDLNEGWEFTARPESDFYQGGSQETVLVRLPHTGTELPWNYTDENAYQYISAYRRSLVLPPLSGGKRVFLRFDGVAHKARLFVNGKLLRTHRCGYTAFTVELTEHVRAGENLLALEVDSRETLDQPPFGNVIDYLTYQGIYRGCSLFVTEAAWTADVYVRTRGSQVLAELVVDGPGAALAELSVTGPDGREAVRKTVKLSDARAGSLPLPAGLPARREAMHSYELQLDCREVRRWSPEYPELYRLDVSLYRESGELLDQRRVRFGFREAEFRKDGFYLNGEKRLLRGLNRHQSFPFVGYAMPDSVQRRDAEILRYELGLDVVRTSHYPQSQAFLDRCDEIGLLVFTEIPGWQHIGGDAWKKQVLRNVDDMVSQSRNHPSVVLWGVRINESMDDDELYRRTNALSREMDPDRQTGGVRYLRKSSLLEDVYTYNDFSHTGKNPGLVSRELSAPDPECPYLVTEYNGHMFPTKSFDDESHRLEHALRHARVLDAMYGAQDISGCIGWCAFDYNTHREFGSGDRICYHGVMDMYRNPKLAAAVYASQRDGEPVLEISSSMDRGEYPGGTVDTVWAFTNADFVRLYRNGKPVRDFYPDFRAFPNMPHPPVRIDDFIGDVLVEQEGLSPRTAEKLKALWAGEGGASLKSLSLLLDGIDAQRAARLEAKYRSGWGDGSDSWRFEALRKGEAVAVRTLEPVTRTCLELEPERLTLNEQGMWDAVLVRIRVCDQNGNRLWYAGDPLLMEVEGPLRCIGPRAISLRGGAAGVWLRTTGEEGRAVLTVAWRGKQEELDFTIQKRMETL